jgi:hypothetical protein
MATVRHFEVMSYFSQLFYFLYVFVSVCPSLSSLNNLEPPGTNAL